MRRKDESKKPIIVDYINEFFYEHDKIPTVREIVNGTGIPLSTVHRYLVDMQEKGELTYNGYRSARTKEMSEVSPIHGIAVLGTVACGPGQEEEQRFIETIRMPESLVEKGDYFALIAKGESMIGAGIFPGDYVFVKRQHTHYSLVMTKYYFRKMYRLFYILAVVLCTNTCLTEQYSPFG